MILLVFAIIIIKCQKYIDNLKLIYVCHIITVASLFARVGIIANSTVIVVFVNHKKSKLFIFS